ncbi:MAG: winged helix-turn-helix transcriptional regulator, partial [Candidatus Heimdallarchaeota archaeon]|nr:winged helix-turn-helix transcriptional regulator [Candidatus Heimdallarchaeota archaeon]
MSLNTSDLALILAMEEDPFITITSLANKLDLSRPTVKKRIENLKEAGMLSKPIALYNPEKIGLERKHVFASVSNKESLDIMEKACDEHPYTKYRARTFGGGFGIYMQYEIPPQTFKMLKEFLTTLGDAGIIKDYHVFESTGLRTVTYPDLNKFDSGNLTWDFSWENWFKSLKNYTYSVKQNIKVKRDFSTYKPIHFSILRELTT